MWKRRQQCELPLRNRSVLGRPVPCLPYTVIDPAAATKAPVGHLQPPITAHNRPQPPPALGSHGRRPGVTGALSHMLKHM